MIGEIGRTLTAIEPGKPGRVAVHGEIWQASADEAIPADVRVQIKRVDGLMLTVSKD
jgi:membrane-bound serine protease (ClpP class)